MKKSASAGMDPSAKNEDKDQYFLDLFKIEEGRYVVGIFQEGITVYKQQLRALNVLYCLIKLGKIDKKDKIAIIGGGVAGLTVSAAAIKAGLNVTLFEKQRIFLNVQYGCETRRLYPHLYDWPDKRALFPYADLPVLNWKSDTAHEVSVQMFDAFINIKNSNSSKFKSYNNCTINKIKTVGSKFEIDYQYKDSDAGEQKGSGIFNFIIYTPGYGIELDDSSSTPSYWRNDDFAQLRLAHREKNYLVSGAGDGGLIDLLRLKIFGFNEISILNELNKKASTLSLIRELKKVQDDWNSMETKENNWIFYQFEKLDSKALLYEIKKIFRNKERKKNIVWLNSNQENFKEILNLDRISLLNALFIFCLYKLEGFEYLGGSLANATETLKHLYDDPNCKKIIRHGTSREKTLSEVLLTEDEIENFKLKQKNFFRDINKASRRWPPGWWSTQFIKDKYKPRIEFFTPDTQSVCSGFISVLSRMIEYYHQKEGKKKDFRVTLHRIVEIQEEYFFQQITRYFGTRDIGEVGRVFPIKGGIVGFSARTGKALILEKKTEDQFKALFNMIHFDTINARILDKNVASLLTVPILGIRNSKNYTNLVLYIDSFEKDFFEHDEDLFPLIIKTVEGFMDSIKRLLMDKQIVMGELDFSPPEILVEDADKTILQNSCIRDVTGKIPKKSILTFKNYHSFNIISKNDHDPFQ